MLCAALREAALLHPDTQYTLLSRPKMRAFLSVMPRNVQFLAYGERIDWSQYDTVIDAHSVNRSIGLDVIALLHGKRVRRLHKPRIARWMLLHGRRKPIRPMIERYRQLFGIDPSTPIQREDNGKSRHGIGIAPFAAHLGKIYPLYLMETVVSELSKTGEAIYLFGGGEKEKQILQQWEERYPNVQSMAGKFNMEQELELMGRLRIMLTMDSGNMHMASLMGTRVVSIWGATHPLAGFLGYGQVADDCISTNLPCRPCSIYGKKACKFGDYRCMTRITPQQIVEKIQW